MSTSTDTPQMPAPDADRRQIRLYKRLAAFLALALIVGVAAFLILRHLGQPVTIFVNGKPVATVANRSAANALITAAEQAKVGAAYAGDEPKRMQKILLLPAPANAPQDPDNIVKAKLMGMLTLKVHAFVILVNGRQSLALPTSEAATQTLQLVKDHWAQAPPPADLADSPEIVEHIDIEKHAVDTRLTRQSADDAAPYFWTPTRSKTYKVQRGDLGSRLAHRFHLSLSDLITSNPNVNLNRLKPGDVVNVQKMPILLTVRVRKKLVTTEKVHPNAPAAQAGQQRVTYVVTYINGQETRREAQDIEILEKPLTRMDL